MAGAGGDADSSDDDIEVVPNSVDNYWLEDAGEAPVSFADLPFFKTGKENLPNKLVYVRGAQDNGMRLYVRAMAWKLEFTKGMMPVFNLKTEKYWIKLKKPRKSFETTIRSIISTATFLNYAIMNPGDSEKAAWNYVKNAYKSWDVAPSRDDLTSHLLVIKHLIESNERLASSMALQTIHTGVPRKRLASAREKAQQSSDLHQDRPGKEPSADGEVSDKDGKDLDLDEGGDLAEGESICCICDDGGDMICCDGPCMRSFHFKEAACGRSTLGLSKIEADRMDKFFCPNCKLKRHQCFVCGDLGCSDDTAGAAREVFLCGVDKCGHFYHPRCVAELLLKDRDTSKQVAMVESIKEGKRFVCPMHNCWKCGQKEVKETKNLQFGICRRCPRVWHRQCLPPSLLHSDPKRCWPGLLPNRILVYCNRHTIVPDLATPARNHIKFPEGSGPSVRKKIVKGKAEEEEKKSKPSKLGHLKKKVATSLKSLGGHTATKPLGTKRKSTASLVKQTKPGGHESTKSKLNQSGMARDPLLAASLKSKSISAKQDLLSQKNEQKFTSQCESIPNLDAKLARTSAVAAAKSATPSTSASLPLPPQTKNAVSCKISLADKEGETTVDDIIEGAKASISIESMLKKHEALANSTDCSKNQDRKQFLGKLESIIKGMGKAVETLENGGSVEDAKLHCPQDYISYIKSCSEDLELYLGPLLHDTSDAGRPIKEGKIKVMVDRVHSYLEAYDTILDVTSGLDDFSLLLKKKLEESGKVCEYNNFDLIQTDNVNFSKRDWFEVKPSEMPNGDRLIIRLNLPKGLKANQFLGHALAFKPKLIVLTVPKEVQRLDLMCGSYDLVWADLNFWEGHTLNSPGPIDGQENSLNGCDSAPCLLYFWSRPDWTLKYKQIALDQGHILALTSSDFAGSPLKVSSSRPSLHSDFDMKMNRGIQTAVEFGREEEIGELGESKHNRSQGELVRSTGGKEGSGDSNKKTSNMLQGEDLIMQEPTGGRGSISEMGTFNALKLDQMVRRRASIKCHVSEYDTRVTDNSSKSKVETSSSDSKNDSSVPPKKRVILKRKAVDSPDVEPSGSQSNKRSCSQESAEKARSSSEHGVSRKERKTDDDHICGDEKRNLELVDDKAIGEKYLAKNEADLRGKRSPDKQGICELGGRKLPGKYGSSRQGEARAASPERPQHSGIPNERSIESPNKAFPSAAVDPGKKVVSKSVKTEDSVNPQLPKSVSRNDNAAQDELVKRSIWGPGTPSAQMAQGWDSSIRCNAQMPVPYHGAASATHPGSQLPFPPSGMQGTCSSNHYGTIHPFGSSGAGRALILPGGQWSHQYFVPGTYTPSSSSPIYSPAQPVHLPPGYGSVRFQHYGPLPVQQYGRLVIQPQRPQFPERPPNQRNTGGWFDD